MNIYIYIDESGVFDPTGEEFFVYGGIILLGKNQKDDMNRLYLNAERTLRRNSSYLSNRQEIKASILRLQDKMKLFRSINRGQKFGAVLNQRQVHEGFLAHKKLKQRFLDYVLVSSLQNALQKMIRNGELDSAAIDHIYIRMDQHTAATDNVYELGLRFEEVFKCGLPDYPYNYCEPPVFPQMTGGVTVNMRDSAKDPLIRVSDIIANCLLNCAKDNEFKPVGKKVLITMAPRFVSTI